MITDMHLQVKAMLGYLFVPGVKKVIVNNASKQTKNEGFTVEALDHLHQDHGYVFLYESTTDELIISKEA